MEQKQTLIAILLMLAVWVGFTILFPPTGPPPAVETRNEEPTETARTVLPAVPTPLPSALPPVAEIRTESRPVTFAGADVVFQLDAATGEVRRVTLPGYRQAISADSPAVDLIDAPPQAPGVLTVTGSGAFEGIGRAWHGIDIPPGVTQLPQEVLLLQQSLPNGVVVEKLLRFPRQGYVLPITLRIYNQGEHPVSGNLNLNLTQPWDDAESGGFYDFVGPTTLTASKKHSEKISDVEKQMRTYSEEIAWSGVELKYFLSALVPFGDSAVQASVHKQGELLTNTLMGPYQTLQPGMALELDYMGYFGPKDYELLKGIGHRLEEAVDFGFFGFLARPLLHVLKFFHSFLNNYGLAIILLTVIIKILFWPLTQKSYVSMKGMQKLQPKMQKLREKYKDDKQRLNVELMNLYKEHRVNPLGGCLPMLVQIPVFFALYKVLMVAIELRHAHFFLWITDLSAKDPFYITPLIMGATMFIQMKMTPSQMDPMQQKIFLSMPIIFTALFLNFPSGLVLYWLINNVLTIGQQYLIYRKKD